MAEEASVLARQFLAICIRAIDYCPPVDIEFGEFLRAVITADRDLVPDDPWDYREAWIEAFRRRRIQPQSMATLSEDALLWSPPDRRQAREIGELVTSANCIRDRASVASAPPRRAKRAAPRRAQSARHPRTSEASAPSARRNSAERP